MSLSVPRLTPAGARSPPSGRWRFLPGCTSRVKTAISVPDDTFKRVDRRAAELGVNRSQFYATAATRYLEELDRSSLTSRINDALALVGDDEDSAVAVAHSRRRLAVDDNW